MSKNSEKNHSTRTIARWTTALIVWLALGLSSFAQPKIDSPAQTESVVAQVDVAAPPPSAIEPTQRGCSAETPATSERDSAIAAAASYFHAHRSRLTDTEIQQVAEVVVDCAYHYDLDPELVIAVIHVESRGNAYALSGVGAMGLMQIMPTTGEELAEQLGIRWIGAEMLFEPQVNVRMGIAYLRKLERRFGNWSTALAAYNWGPARISQRLRSGTTLPVVYSTSVLTARREQI